MPSIFRILGYNIYFWSNETNEPLHVHICKGEPHENNTKIWINHNGETIVSYHNVREINNKDLNKVLQAIKSNIQLIQDKWLGHFDHIEYHKDFN